MRSLCRCYIRIGANCFYQVLNVHGLRDETLLSSFVLVIGKKRLLYDETFTFVKKVTNIKLQVSVTDFELALQHSLHFVFLDVRFVDYNYDFSETIYRVAYRIGFNSCAKDKTELQHWLRKSMSTFAFGSHRRIPSKPLPSLAASRRTPKSATNC